MLIAAYGRKKEVYLGELSERIAHLDFDEENEIYFSRIKFLFNYLITGQNFPAPTIIDKNRMLRGDVFKKPTAYWFFNCEPTRGFTLQNDKKQKIIQDCHRSNGDGLCSEERSMITPDYARNFICDFILGKIQHNIGEPQFDFGN